MLSVGGGGKGSEPFAGVARDPARRERFAQSSLALVQQFGIDGIDSQYTHISVIRQALNQLQLTGSTRLMPARARTTLLC